MNIAVVGGMGRLGSEIVKALQEEHHVEIFDKKKNCELSGAQNFDCVVDASTPSNSVVLAKICAKSRVPLLVCTTGHSQKQLKQIENYFSKTTIVLCPNLSVGINAVCSWLENSNFENCEVSIFERHHTKKVDKPSGTALMLKTKMQKFCQNVEVVSSRLGTELGTHTITIDLPFEQIEICHKVKNRLAFSVGTKNLIEKIVKEHRQKYEN